MARRTPYLPPFGILGTGLHSSATRCFLPGPGRLFCSLCSLAHVSASRVARTRYSLVAPRSKSPKSTQMVAPGNLPAASPRLASRSDKPEGKVNQHQTPVSNSLPVHPPPERRRRSESPSIRAAPLQPPQHLLRQPAEPRTRRSGGGQVRLLSICRPSGAVPRRICNVPQPWRSATIGCIHQLRKTVRRFHAAIRRHPARSCC